MSRLPNPANGATQSSFNVRLPTPTHNVGRALRAAYPGEVAKLPPEFQRLLDQIH